MKTRALTRLFVTTLLAGLLAVGCDKSGDSTSSAAGVTFGKSTVKVGDKHTSTVAFIMESSISDGDGDGSSTKTTTSMTVDIDVLEVRDDQASKQKLTYKKVRSTIAAFGGESDMLDASAVQGKSFIAEIKRDGAETKDVTITTADGKAADENAKMFVMMTLAYRNLVDMKLPSRPLLPGEDVPELADSKDKGDADTLKARFVKTTGDSGLFERTVKATLPGAEKMGTMQVEMTCKTNMRIADGRLRSSTCETDTKLPNLPGMAKMKMKMTVSVNNRYPGDPPASEKPAADKPAKNSSKVVDDPACYREERLSDRKTSDLTTRHIRSGNEKAVICPGLFEPTIVIDEGGIALLGHQVVPKGTKHDTDRMVQIEPLKTRLRKFRVRRNFLQPGYARDVPTKLTIKAAPGTPTAIVLSAMWSAVFGGAGNNIHIESGSTAVDIPLWVARPPEQYSPDRALYVEPQADGKVVSGFFVGGPHLDDQKTLETVDGFGGWLGPYCKDHPLRCEVTRLVFRARDLPIEQTLKTLKPVLEATKGMAKDKKLGGVSLQFHCPVFPASSRDEAIKGPWGRPAPAERCFSGTDAESAARRKNMKPPRIRVGALSVSGRLPPEVIQRIVRQNFGQFRLCYENGLRTNPKLEGRVTVRFVITKEGTVSNVSGGGALPDHGVILCVAQSFYDLTFPKPEGGIVTVGYPILFAPGK